MELRMLIEMQARDLMIAEVIDKDSGKPVEVVRIKGGCAFDPDFIEECKLKGVRKIEERNDQGEPV